MLGIVALGKWRRNKKSKLRFEKEALPIGDHVKWIRDGQETIVRVRREFLDKLVKQFKKMQSAGVRVPLFATHIEHPDNERGLVKDLKIKQNKQGVDSLHAVVEFHNEAAAEQGTKVDVSVGCPPKFKDSKGNVYDFALRHLALTSKPVISGLGEFEPVIMSYDTPSGLMMAEGDNTMNEIIEQILAELGIEAPEGSDEAAKLRLVLQAVKNLETVEEEEEAPEAEPALNLSHSPILVKQFLRSRESIIDGLVKDSVLSPGRADKWRKKYATSDAIKADLELSHDSDDDTETEFDRMVEEAKELAKDRPLKERGRDAKAMLLSHDGKSDNPLIADAKKRRESASKR